MNIETLSFVPEQLTRLCLGDSTNVKKMANSVTDLAFESSAFRVLIESRFNFSFENDSFIKFFSDYGVKSFRDELALCYLSYGIDKSFYSDSAKIHLDEILKIEDELFEYISSSDYKPFILLFHLKNNDIEARKEGVNQFMNSYDFHKIKKILSNYQTNLKRTDWLIVLIKSLLDIYKEDTEAKILENKGSFSKVLNSLSMDQRKIIVNNHLSYGQSIGDTDYFLFNKV
jgi:hypothetical protein